MYQRIVVPLDGSELAEGILPIVNQLAGGLSANVELLAVVDREAVTSGRPPADSPGNSVSIDTVAKAEEYLHGIVGRVQAPAQVRTTVTARPATEGITREAKRQPRTLVAMSTHGLSGAGRFTLGSVTAKVILETDVPMLLYRPRSENQEAEKLSTAIVPLDGSPLAEHVLAAVRDLAKSLGLQVVLARALNADQASLGLGADWVSVWAGEVGAVYSYLTAKERELRQAGVKVRSELLEGEAASEIVGLVQRIPNALVIMSTHGHSGTEGSVLGSVAHRVVGSANAPVLLLRP